MSENVGTSNSRNHKGLRGLYKDNLTLPSPFTVEIGSGAIIYILSFINIWSSIQNFIGEDSQTQRNSGELISLTLFFQDKGSLLKIRIGNYKKD
jgi:hypothetical protein